MTTRKKVLAYFTLQTIFIITYMFGYTSKVLPHKYPHGLGVDKYISEFWLFLPYAMNSSIIFKIVVILEILIAIGLVISILPQPEGSQ